MKIKLAGIVYESLVNGEGLRRVFFSQGCTHNCKGCFNPDTHSFNGGKVFEIEDLVKDVVNNPMLNKVTFSGGDPFQQSYAFWYFSEKLKKHNINIWAYTGYTFEELIDDKDPFKRFLLKNIDVLVDGRFDISKKREGLLFKGSEDQRIIDVNKTLKQNRVVLYKLKESR